MRILITGSSGFVGSVLIPALEQAGHTVFRLVRSTEQTSEHNIFWNPSAYRIERAKLPGFDAVIHLAGENIAGRWTETKKERIRASRVDATRFLCNTLIHLPAPPRVFISASATGYYGNRGDEILDESSTPGDDYLADVCRAWEEGAQPIHDAGVRTVHLRIGLVLSPDGGALKRMLVPFRLGLGGIIGDGRQYISWVTLDDLVGVIRFVLDREDLSGPFNAVAPHPVTNTEFTRALGRVLHRPTFLPVPAFAIRRLLGEMGEALLLGSACVYPRKLEEAGYGFLYPDIETALKMILQR